MPLVGIEVIFAKLGEDVPQLASSLDTPGGGGEKIEERAFFRITVETMAMARFR